MNGTSRKPYRALGSPVSVGFALLFASVSAACGNLTAGGLDEATATVYITGDAEEESPTMTDSEGYTPFPSSVGIDGPSAVGTLLGNLEVTLEVLVRRGDGSWLDLTGGEQPITLPISGGNLEELVSQPIEPALYDQVRVVFHTVEADVTGGLEIGGVPITGRIRVQNTAPIVVEQEFELTVSAQQVMEISIDLNAGDWLPTASPTGLEVSVEEFQAAVELTARNVGQLGGAIGYAKPAPAP